MAERTARRPRRPAQEREAEEFEPETEPEERSSRRPSSRPSRRAAPRARDEEPDADDDAPKGRRGRSGRSRGDDDEPDEKGGKDNGLQGGWGSWRQRKAEASDWADDFKVEYKEKYLVLFLDNSPFVAFNEHWVDEVPTGTKKSWNCIGKGCPLCEVLGEKPKAKAMFNVIEFLETETEGEREPVHKVWTIGSGVANTLEEIADDVGLEGNYFKVWKTKKGSGKGGSTDYHVDHVKERDLEEDWDFPGLGDDEYAEFEKNRYDATYVAMPTRKKLKEIADMVMEDD